MKSFDLYGINLSDLSDARAAVESIFEISMEERDSGYQGGIYYLFGDRGSENFILKRNIDIDDGEPAELEFPEYPVLLYINKTVRPAEIKEIIEKMSFAFFLRHEEI